MMNAAPTEFEGLCLSLRQMLATELRLPLEEIQVDKPLTEYGLDSIGALMLSGELEECYQVELPPTLLWDCPTIHHLAGYLQSLLHPVAVVV